MEIVEQAADDLIWQEEDEKARESHAVNGEVLVDTSYKDGMLYGKGKIWLPRDKAPKKMVFENDHDTLVAGHMGMDETLEVIKRNFYRPRMAKDIEDYVRSCNDCQRKKGSRHKIMVRYNLLNCPSLHGIQFLRISLHTFQCLRIVLQYG